MTHLGALPTLVGGPILLGISNKVAINKQYCACHKMYYVISENGL